MNHFKRITALLVVVMLTITCCVPALSAEGESFKYSNEAGKLNALGLYNGISEEAFEPDLGTALNRETGVVMLLRLFGLENQAQAFTDADTVLAKFSDSNTISLWAKKAVAYAVEKGLVQGLPDGTFGPKAALNGKAYCTLILRKLGYVPDYNNATAELFDKGGITAEEAAEFAEKELIKDDLVGISFGTLSAEDTDGKKLIEILVAENVVDEQAAIEVGLLGVPTPSPSPEPTPVPVKELDIKSAKPLTTRVIEVNLNTAAAAGDVAAAAFQISDPDGKAIEVKAAELAVYDTGSKTVLLTLESDTAAGTPYILASGAKTCNFGGKASDTDLPKVDSVASLDYGQVKVTFNEPVLLEGAGFEISEKYGSKLSLSVSGIKYDGKESLIISTSEQKASTLYGIIISEVRDFSGNKIETDDKRTFVGSKKDTEPLEIPSGKVRVLDYNRIVVEFNKKLDETTIEGSMFKVWEAYGAKTELGVIKAEKPQKADAFVADSEDSREKSVLLTLDGSMKYATLYRVSALSGLKSKYGAELSSTASKLETAFAGTGKPDTALEFEQAAVNVISNTEMDVKFARKVDKEQAEAIANYSVSEAYGTKTALSVESASLNEDGKSVRLKTASMKNVLYKLTVTNIKDIYGNPIKTEDNKNTVSLAGKAVSAKISKILEITRPEGKDTILLVRFDQNIGSNAQDVTCYSISNGVGCPEKAEPAASNDDAVNYKSMVKLTIPKTARGTLYKLTVKNLANSDEIAISSGDKVEFNFAGLGK